jgi:hypothetical protein
MGYVGCLMRLQLLAALTICCWSAFAQPVTRTRNVILVTIDGMRWQDLFRGADRLLLSESAGVADLPAMRRQFWRDTPAQRREALMPFVWSVIANQGQLWGNRDLGSDAYVTNSSLLSYPGYHELLVGYSDPRIESNDHQPNPNVTVLEWLHQKAAYRDKIAVFGAWDAFPHILNTERSRLFVNAGYEPYPASATNRRIALLNRLKVETGIWDIQAMDAPVFHTAMEHLRTAKPRVLYLSLGQTDEWGHRNRYDLYLQSAHRVDQYLREIWETVQSMKEYRDLTSLIVTVDHGRGERLDTWLGHNPRIPDAKYVWFGVIGPDTPPLGERARTAPLTLGQVAATLAALLGEDYPAFQKEAGAPIPDVVKH